MGTCDCREVRCDRVILGLLATSCTAHEPPPTAPTNFDRDARLDEARSAMYAGEFDKARHNFESLLERNAQDDEARAYLARLHAWQGEYVRAELLYRDALARHPQDDDLRAGLFDVLAWNQRWNEALQLLDAAPHPETPVLLGLRARWIYADGDVTTARALVEKAETLAPSNLELRALRQRLFTRSGRVTSRMILSAQGAPTLGQMDLSLSQSIHRLRLTFDTEQGARPKSLATSWAYGATYGTGAWWTFSPGWSWGADVSFGAPAAMVPLVRARSRLTVPMRPWLDGSLSYAYRRFVEAIDTQSMSPSIGVTLRGELRLDATYWLTHVRLREGTGAESSRWVQAVGLSAGRTIVPWLAWRGGYAHGAEAEQMPTVFQLLDLVNDSIYVGLRFFPTGFVSIEPLYGVAWRGPRGGTRQVQHTLEVGFVVKN